MKKTYLLIFTLLFSCCSTKKIHTSLCSSNSYVASYMETQYFCDHPDIHKDQSYGFLVYNSDVQNPQKGFIDVTITFDSIKSPTDSVRILSVFPNWIRLKDLETDSIVINQSLYDGTTDTTLLRYQVELLSKIKECDCNIVRFYEELVPLRIRHYFPFTVLPTK